MVAPEVAVLSRKIERAPWCELEGVFHGTSFDRATAVRLVVAVVGSIVSKTAFMHWRFWAGHPGALPTLTSQRVPVAWEKAKITGVDAVESVVTNTSLICGTLVYSECLT